MYNFILLSLSFLFLTTSFSRETVLLQSTTSIKNSGFYDYILPIFKNDTGIEVRVVAVGTGAAVRNIMNCDGDAILAHNLKDEKRLLSSGYAVNRKQFMHNDFVIIGPSNDPAKISDLDSPYLALKSILSTASIFLSRGDDSGTHNLEKQLWKKIDINPLNGKGKWYYETGTSMGSTINTAIGLGGYTLTDRATWISFSNKVDFKILIESNNHMPNNYSILSTNKDKCPHANNYSSQIFTKWLISKKGQKLIELFKKENQQLFYPSIYK